LNFGIQGMEDSDLFELIAYQEKLKEEIKRYFRDLLEGDNHNMRVGN